MLLLHFCPVEGTIMSVYLSETVFGSHPQNWTVLRTPQPWILLSLKSGTVTRLWCVKLRLQWWTVDMWLYNVSPTPLYYRQEYCSSVHKLTEITIIIAQFIHFSAFSPKNGIINVTKYEEHRSRYIGNVFLNTHKLHSLIWGHFWSLYSKFWMRNTIFSLHNLTPDFAPLYLGHAQILLWCLYRVLSEEWQTGEYVEHRWSVQERWPLNHVGPI